MTYLEVLVLLIMGHYIFDWVLQKEFIAFAKNPDEPLPGVPWIHAMIAHCFLHAGTVFLITHMWGLFVIEFISHFILDYSKCRKYISFNTDQISHLSLKLLYFVLYVIYTTDYQIVIHLQ